MRKGSLLDDNLEDELIDEMSDILSENDIQETELSIHKESELMYDSYLMTKKF